MKRAHDGDDVSPSPKRIRRSISITDANLDEVRKQYRADCEIIATNGEPVPARGPDGDAETTGAVNPEFRVFPVNHIVAVGWSEPFGVMIEGSFAEAASGRVYLPFSPNVVAAVVQHMYFTANMADAPEIAPEDAFAVMEIAHMYERMDLFALAQTAFWDSNPTLLATKDGNGLVLRALRLGVDAKKLYAMYERGKTYTDGIFDPNDETMKPFLAEFVSRSIKPHYVIAWTDYTQELRTATLYSVFSPSYWKNIITWIERKVEKSDCVKVVRVLCKFSTLVAYAGELTKCGVITKDKMRRVVAEIVARIDLPVDVIREARRMLDNEFDDDEYCALMRRVYPLPPATAAAIVGGAP